MIWAVVRLPINPVSELEPLLTGHSVYVYACCILIGQHEFVYVLDKFILCSGMKFYLVLCQFSSGQFIIEHLNNTKFTALHKGILILILFRAETSDSIFQMYVFINQSIDYQLSILRDSDAKHECDDMIN